jgi:hypothetical protein
MYTYFALNDAKPIDSIRCFLSSGGISISGSHLWNGLHEQAFGFSKTARLELSSNDFSNFFVEVLEDIRSRESFTIVSEDDLLKGLLELGEKYRSFVKWIDIRFLNSDGLATLIDHLEFPLECIWRAVVNHLLHSLWLDSTIISDVPDTLSN